jgi:hypothetical protein
VPELIQQSVVLPAPSESLYDMSLEPAARSAFTVAERSTEFYWDERRA